MSRFFELRGYPELAWMHHLACKRYGEAAADLLVVDKLETDLSQKHVGDHWLSWELPIDWLVA